MRKPMIFFGTLLVLTLVVIFGREFVKGKVNTSKAKTESHIQTTAGNQFQPKHLPQHIGYWVMFHHIALLNRQADEAESRGEDGSKYRLRYKKFANLNDPQSKLLTTIALDTYKQVMETDAKAKQLVAAIRARTPEGRLLAGEKLPVVPAELKELQGQRDGIIEFGYAKLRQGYGDSAFARLDKFVDRHIEKQLYSIDRNSLQISGNEPQLLHKAGRIQ
jgi:hypothetical protein